MVHDVTQTESISLAPPGEQSHARGSAAGQRLCAWFVCRRCRRALLTASQTVPTGAAQDCSGDGNPLVREHSAVHVRHSRTAGTCQATSLSDLSWSREGLTTPSFPTIIFINYIHRI